MMKRLIYAAIGVLLLLAGPVVYAHDGGATGYASITIDRHMVRYKLTLSTIPKGPLATAMAVNGKTAQPKFELFAGAIAEQLRFTADGTACQAGPRHTVPPNRTIANIVAQVDFVCHRAIRKLTIRDDLFDVLGDDIHTLARIDWRGGSQQFVFRPESRETTIVLAGNGTTVSTGRSYRGAESFFPLGVEHILTGYDHLLFLLALILGGGSLIHMIKIVTGFTIAHSITLALAALEIVDVPGHLVEALIALSIAYVAAENLYPRYAISRRWLVSFLFGAVHGLGFSTILREAGLVGENLVWSLLSFNLGVEFGQAVLVLIALPIVIRLSGYDWGRKITMATSAVILIVGLVLFAERVFFQA